MGNMAPSRQSLVLLEDGGGGGRPPRRPAIGTTSDLSDGRNWQHSESNGVTPENAHEFLRSLLEFLVEGNDMPILKTWSYTSLPKSAFDPKVSYDENGQETITKPGWMDCHPFTNLEAKEEFRWEYWVKQHQFVSEGTIWVVKVCQSGLIAVHRNEYRDWGPDYDTNSTFGCRILTNSLFAVAAMKSLIDIASTHASDAKITPAHLIASWEADMREMPGSEYM